MSLAYLLVPILGQIFTLLICMLGIGTAIFFGYKGNTSAAITSIIGGIAPILITAITNINKK